MDSATGAAQPPAGASLARNNAHQEAYERAVKAMSENMPLLLHGSGDVMPSQVKPETAHLLSVLTVQYIEKLVDASLDVHFQFLSEADGGGEYKVPPPSFPQRSEKPCKPPPFSVTHPPEKKKTLAPGTSIALGLAESKKELEEPRERERPKKRLRDEYWDEALPKPKIRSKQQKEMDAQNASKSSGKAKAVTAFNTDPNAEILPPQANLREWVGAMGVDLRENVIRKAHVKNAIGTPSFVFCICHDVYAFNRVREIRAAKRTLDPIVTDSVLTDMIAKEGRIRGSAMDEAKREDDPQDEDEAAREEEEGPGPEWPGLEYVLPVHLLKDS